MTVGDGQWAYSVQAVSSEWPGDPYDWRAVRTLGVPDVPEYGDSEKAWAAEGMNQGPVALTLGLEEAVAASGFVIRESNANGFVTKVEFHAAGGGWNLAWSGTDTSAPGAVEDFRYMLGGGATGYNVDAVRITVDTCHDMDDWEEIDAVYVFGAAVGSNAAPVAADDDEVEVDEDDWVSIDVLDNDADGDGDPLFLSVTTEPEHGYVYIDTNGTPDDLYDDELVYVPDADFNGTDTFGYTITDLSGASDSALVTVTVNAVNDAPVAYDDWAVADQDTPLNIDVLANDYDVDEDLLSLAIDSGPSSGSASVDNGEIVYTPDESFTGLDSFSYEVSDGNGGTALATVSVLVYETGQWASSVVDVSSEYVDEENEGAWAAEQALGEPDTFYYGDSEAAWAPEEADDGEQYLTVGFADPAAATGVVVRENLGNGFVTRIVLIADDAYDTPYTVWEDTDPSEADAPADLIVHFEQTNYDVKQVQVFIDTDHTEFDWEEIDAVRLITAAPPPEQRALFFFEGEGGGLGSEAGGAVAVAALGAGVWSRTIGDAQGRPVLVETYRGATLIRQDEYAYDAEGGFLSEQTTTDALGRMTHTGYDADGHVESRTLAHGTADAATTSYVYADGNLVSLTDPDGNTTEWTYEGGLETSMTDPLSHTVYKGYDAFGRLASVTDRNGLLRTFGYDPHGRLVRETWYAADHSTVVDTLTFKYNTRGQLRQASNGSGTYTFTYNSRGQLTRVVEPFDVTLNFGYDGAGNRNLITDSIGGSVASTYEAGHLISRVFSQGGQPTLRIDQEYDEVGRLTLQSRYSDAEGNTLVAESEYGYDEDGRLESLVHAPAADDPIEYTWDYDSEGQMVGESDHGASFTYSYDGQGQLTGDGTDTWEYDANGNRDYGAYVVGDDNRLEADATWEYDYDPAGNLQWKSQGEEAETWTYGYNHRGQLLWAEKHATDGGALQLRVEFGYDAFGNRVEKRVDEDGDDDIDHTQRYAYDGWKAVNTSLVGNESWDVWADLDGADDLQTRYLRGDGIDELFARIDSDDAFWYLNDHLGSAREILDETGEVIKSVAYDAFGGIASQSGAGELGRYRWTGREWDAEIELQYNRARYYDPNTGRWTSQDPLGFDAGDSNLYRYAANVPTQRTDPSGMQVQVPEHLKQTTLPDGRIVVTNIDEQPVAPINGKAGEQIFYSGNAVIWKKVDNNYVVDSGEHVVAADGRISFKHDFFGYDGTDVRRIRWIQVMSFYYYWITQSKENKLVSKAAQAGQFLETKKENKKHLSYEVNVLKTSDQKTRHVFLDSRNAGDLYFHDDTKQETYRGGSTKQLSWMSDGPTFAKVLANRLAEHPDTTRIFAKNKPNNVLGEVVMVKFNTFAVDISKKNAIEGAFAWSVYASRTFVAGQGVNVTGELEYNGLIMDTEIHQSRLVPDNQILQDAKLMGSLRSPTDQKGKVKKW